MAENAEENEEEPSIEEILDSIRQIIADEDDDEEREAVGDFDDDEAIEEPELEPEPEEMVVPVSEPELTPEPEPEPAEEIVDLTEKVEEDSSMEIDMVDLDDELEDDLDEDDDSEDDKLLTEKAEHAAVDAISQLAKKTAVEYNGITLEEIVRSEIKPMLRDWLDKNLPSLIERLVQEELERVSKRVLDE
tara:strand:+ start:670 stop:1239 length:570 start_codon:yes stop_codon:yes gene_type:complete